MEMSLWHQFLDVQGIFIIRMFWRETRTRVESNSGPFYFFHISFQYFIVPCTKFGSPYSTAAERAALPIPTNVCNIFVSNSGMAASVWDFWCAQILMYAGAHMYRDHMGEISLGEISLVALGAWTCVTSMTGFINWVTLALMWYKELPIFFFPL